MSAESRYVIEIPVRWSSTDEAVASRRIQTLARLENEVLARYIARANAYRRDPDFLALLAERREAILDERLPAPKKKAKKPLRHVPEEVTPRRFFFTTKEERRAAWKAVQERHGLFGDMKIDSLTPEGRAHYEADKTYAGSLTARQRDLGSIGIDAATINPTMIPKQRDRVLAWLGMKPMKSALGGRRIVGRPRFNSGGHRKMSVAFASGTNANKAGLVVDFTDGTATWKAARGKYPIVARLRWPKNDPYLWKAAMGDIAEVKILYREVRGNRRWFVQVTMKGVPPIRPALRDAVVRRPSGTVGVDIGSRHVAVVGPEAALLDDFAPTMMRRETTRDKDIIDHRDGDRVKKDRWARRLQRRISRQRERHPANTNARKTIKRTLRKTRDGKAVGKTVEIEAGFKKGAKVATSGRVRKQLARLAEVARADAAARKNDHGRLANRIAGLGDTIVLERLSYVAWQKSFGRQVRRYAPGAFEAHLRQRAPLLGIEVRGIDTSARLSQLCHNCNAFERTSIRGPIATRSKAACSCGREVVQRDLYSAFLARFACEDSSVDLHAAKAAWTGAFGLLCSAQRMYERAHATGSPVAGGGTRTSSTPSTPDALLSPAVNASGAHQPNILERPTPTSVRDADAREIGDDDSFERCDGSDATQSRSNAVVRAPLPPSEAHKRRRRARAEPPLENSLEKPHKIRDS